MTGELASMDTCWSQGPKLLTDPRGFLSTGRDVKAKVSWPF